MRTGPFSSPAVIERINSRFVAAYVVNEDYAESGPAPAADKAERNRIYRATLDAGMSAGTVHAYLVAPDGTPLDGIHVAEAAKTDHLIARIDKLLQQREWPPAGPPLFAPRPRSAPPACHEGGLRLHLAARGLGGGGSWDGVAEDWIVYSPEEMKLLLPAGDPTPGHVWTPDPELVARLLRHVYPVTENNDVAKNVIEHQELTGRILSITGGVTRARLDGAMRMQHDFYHKPDGKVVETGLLGYVEFDAEGIRAFRLVTEGGRYGGGTFGVAVRSE